MKFPAKLNFKIPILMQEYTAPSWFIEWNTRSQRVLDEELKKHGRGWNWWKDTNLTARHTFVNAISSRFDRDLLIRAVDASESLATAAWMRFFYELKIPRQSYHFHYDEKNKKILAYLGMQSIYQKVSEEVGRVAGHIYGIQKTL